jgi:hypothetical protein
MIAAKLSIMSLNNGVTINEKKESTNEKLEKFSTKSRKVARALSLIYWVIFLLIKF